MFTTDASDGCPVPEHAAVQFLGTFCDRKEASTGETHDQDTDLRGRTLIPSASNYVVRPGSVRDRKLATVDQLRQYAVTDSVDLGCAWSQSMLIFSHRMTTYPTRDLASL